MPLKRKAKMGRAGISVDTPDREERKRIVAYLRRCLGGERIYHVEPTISEFIERMIAKIESGEYEQEL